MLHYSKDLKKSLCGCTGEYSITNKKQYADCPKCIRALNGQDVMSHTKYDTPILSMNSEAYRGNYGS